MGFGEVFAKMFLIDSCIQTQDGSFKYSFSPVKLP